MTIGVVLIAALVSAAPPGAVAQPHDTFADTQNGVHSSAIDALAQRGIFEGTLCGEHAFCPSQPVRRATMAVWLVRALEAEEPADIDTSRFEDIDTGNWESAYIERLAELEISLGCGAQPPRYCPDRAVTRAQMASFLVRAFDLQAADSVGFTDTADSSHAASIDALAEAGITAGCQQDPLRYCPDRLVTRAQMATFLARALGVTELSLPDSEDSTSEQSDDESGTTEGTNPPFNDSIEVVEDWSTASAAYKLSWDPVPGASHYHVTGFDGCTDGSCHWPTATTSITLHEGELGLIVGQSYTITVLACGDGLEEEWADQLDEAGCFALGRTMIEAKPKSFEVVRFSIIDPTGWMYPGTTTIAGAMYAAAWPAHPDTDSYVAVARGTWCGTDGECRLARKGPNRGEYATVANLVTARFALEYGQTYEIAVYRGECIGPVWSETCVLHAEGSVTVPSRES